MDRSHDFQPRGTCKEYIALSRKNFYAITSKEVFYALRDSGMFKEGPFFETGGQDTWEGIQAYGQLYGTLHRLNCPFPCVDKRDLEKLSTATDVPIIFCELNSVLNKKVNDRIARKKLD